MEFYDHTGLRAQLLPITQGLAPALTIDAKAADMLMDVLHRSERFEARADDFERRWADRGVTIKELLKALRVTVEVLRGIHTGRAEPVGEEQVASMALLAEIIKAGRVAIAKAEDH